uniref:Uncharacterized protein n=1 Tax=Fagus sylvatica TaxID=28930 RepID=A0A2N9HQX1_FAGSY
MATKTQTPKPIETHGVTAFQGPSLLLLRRYGVPRRYGVTAFHGVTVLLLHRYSPLRRSKAHLFSLQITGRRRRC